MGSDWNYVSLNGIYRFETIALEQYNIGGYITVLSDGTKKAALFARDYHNEFTLTSGYQCSGPGQSVLCAKLVGDELYVKTTQGAQASYAVLR